MARHKNENWNLPEGTPRGDSNVHSWESIHTALMMDIRDELQRLNTLLHCYRFTGLPVVLDRIDRRLQKHMPLPKGRKKQ